MSLAYLDLPYTGAKGENECGDQSEGNARKIKCGQITDPDCLFSDLSKDIGEKYDHIGIALGLKYKDLENELETGEFKMKSAYKKAMKMLHLWKESATEEECTYDVLAAALEKNGLKSSIATLQMYQNKHKI